MDLDAIAKFVSGVGFPIAFVLICLWGMWQVGKFLAPIVSRITERHVQFMDSLEATTKRQSDTAERQTELIQSNTAMLQDIHVIVKGRQ